MIDEFGENVRDALVGKLRELALIDEEISHITPAKL